MPGRPSRRSVLAAMAAVPPTGAVSASQRGNGASSARTSTTTRVTSGPPCAAARRWSTRSTAPTGTSGGLPADPPAGQGGYAKLSNAARAGNAPDVATIEYPQVPGYAIDGVARDITDLVSDGLRRKLLPRALGLTTLEDRVFAVPLDVEPMVMHYRADLFDQYGLRVARTWDEFAEQAATVRREAPDRRLVLFPTDG